MATKSTEGRRSRRVEDAVRSFLAETLLGEVGDPRLVGLVVTNVEVSPDLGIARVGVRQLAESGGATEREAVTRALARAAGRFRRGLGERLQMKRTPELRFHYDAGHDASERVEALLREIAEESRGKGEP